MSATVRRAGGLFAAIEYSDTSTLRPLVEYVGLVNARSGVLPHLIDAQAPSDCHPFGSSLSARMSVYPSCRSWDPRHSAIARYVTIPSHVSAMFRVDARSI